MDQTFHLNNRWWIFILHQTNDTGLVPVVTLARHIKRPHVCYESRNLYCLMWWLHRKPEGLESDLRAKIGQNGISSARSTSYVACQKVVTYSWTLATTRGDSPSLGTSSPTVWNGSKRSGNFCRVANLGLARMSVASPSQIGRMSLEDSYVTRHGRKSVVSLLTFLQSGNFCWVTWEGHKSFKSESRVTCEWYRIDIGVT